MRTNIARFCRRCRPILWLGAIVFLASANAWAASAEKLNVLFIVTDDMNNDLACYGHPQVQSPNIDRLARQGMRFDRAYCQVTVCNPSRVSFLSGLRPDKTKVYTLSEKTRSHLGDWVMLPEYFRKQGYFTAQVGKIYHTKDGYEDPRSWDVEIREFGKRPPVGEIIKGANPDGPGKHTNDWAWLKTPDAETPDGIVARRAVQIMEQAVAEGKPFFLGAGFRRPHAPFAVPKKYFDLYPVDKVSLPPPVPEGYYASLPPAAINYTAPEKPLTELEQRELRAAYYASNSFVDAQVGVLLEAVDRLKLWDNTIVVFFSDHGYHLGDHGGFWHKLSLFEESDRVPMIVVAPGMKAAGKPCNGLVELIDLYPTLAEMCGLEVPAGLDGINLAPLLDDPSHASKEAAYTVVARSDLPAADHARHLSYLGRTVRTDRWRYTEWDDGRRGVELYDHQNDSQELSNLAENPDYAKNRERLHQLLAASRTDKYAKYGQFAPPDAYLKGSPLAYYGSENEWSRRQFSDYKANKDYKRRGQRQLLAILDGKSEQAIKWSQERLEVDPNDLESLFTQTTARCQQGQLDLAVGAMKKAIAGGLPVERFLAGPRDLLGPLLKTEAFREILSQEPIHLIHGPMLGCVTDQSAKVWVRTAKQEQVEVQVVACDQHGEPTGKIVQTASATSDPQADFTAIIELTGLNPKTKYAYDVRMSGKSMMKGRLPRLQTSPKRGDSTRMQIAFGGGAGYVPKQERMWDTIASYKPDALFLLGDNVYIDLPEKPRGMHRYTYYRRQSRPEFRRLVQSTPVYAIWDDHDCAMDDVWMGPFLDRPDWKQPMLTIFRENWVNPGYGSEQAPGCWFQASVADIDFFFLDTRNYRTNPFGKQPTMLGPVQKSWLLEQIKKSQATFKVLVSSVPWAPEAKPGSRDTWDGFRAEREEIFSTLEAHQVEGVLLLSADRHRSDAWKIERPDGYTFYDMMSSKLTNAHTHECFPGALFCYNAGCSFGLLTIDTTRKDPTATYQIVDIDGKVIHTLPLKQSQLRF